MTRQDLTEEDAELLEELEGEFGRAGGFRRLFPVVSVCVCLSVSVCVCVYRLPPALPRGEGVCVCV